MSDDYRNDLAAAHDRIAELERMLAAKLESVEAVESRVRSLRRERERLVGGQPAFVTAGWARGVCIAMLCVYAVVYASNGDWGFVLAALLLTPVVWGVGHLLVRANREREAIHLRMVDEEIAKAERTLRARARSGSAASAPGA